MSQFTLDHIATWITQASVIIGAIFALIRYTLGKLRLELTEPLKQQVEKLSASVSGLHTIVDELKHDIEDERYKRKEHDSSTYRLIERHNERLVLLETKTGIPVKPDSDIKREEIE